MTHQDHRAPPALKWFAQAAVTVSAPCDVGVTVAGHRRVIPITGGTVQGDGWQARVLSGGADFQRIVNDRLSLLDARYVLETDGGDLIYVVNHAIRTASPEVMAQLLRGEPVPADAVYFRCSPQFETASASLRRIQERLFIGSGYRLPDSVHLHFFEVL